LTGRFWTATGIPSKSEAAPRRTALEKELSMFDMKKLQRMQKDLQEKMSSMQDELADQRVEGTAGGGMVKVAVTGNQEIVEVTINPEAVDPEDVEMLQDLFIAAANQAIEKSKELSQQSMSKVMPGGTGIPGMPF
jgi:DNA-binding YbaB/EbfC family protein